MTAQHKTRHTKTPGRPAPSVWECSHVSDPGPHRAARLMAERERLERRLAWAKRRGEAGKVGRLEEQLAAVEDALAEPPEVLEGTGRAADLRRRWGDEMAKALGW